MLSKHRLVALLVACALTGPALGAEFKISFDWKGLKLCTSGQPNRVFNPKFRVSGLPAGTKFIKFSLKDLDVPSYSHGGGWVKLSANGTVSGNAFKYKSPCPPAGRHTYEWSAKAHAKKSGAVLGQASARRKYPE